MKYKCLIFICLMICFLSIASISAGDVNDNILTDENQNELIATENQDISASGVTDDENNVNAAQDTDVSQKSGELNFTDLKNEIDSGKSEIIFENDYKYADGDSETIYISSYSSSITLIDGDNHVIDGNGQYISISVQKDNVVLKNIKFKNIKSTYSSNVISLIANNITLENCSFEGISLDSGYLISGGYSYENIIVNKCTFTNNSAYYLIYVTNKFSRITNCVFENNTGTQVYKEYNSEAYINNGKYDFDNIWVDKYFLYGDPEWEDMDGIVNFNYYGSDERNILIYINDTLCYNKSAKQLENFIYSLDKVPSGFGKIIILCKDNQTEYVLYKGVIETDYYLSVCLGSNEDDSTDYVIYYDNSPYFVSLPRGVTGTLSVSYENYTNPNASYSKVYRPRFVSKLSANGLSIGPHKITVSLTNDPKYGDKTVEYTFYVTPKIDVPDYVSVGEKEFITLNLPSDYNGVVRIYNGSYVEEENTDEDGYWSYNEYYIKDKLIAYQNVVGSTVKIPVSNLKLGENLIIVNCTGSGDYEDYYYINYIQNSQKFNVNINSNEITVGDDVILSITAPRSSNSMRIYVDGNFYKEVYLDQTVKTEYISKLSVGEHKIKVVYNEEHYDEYDAVSDDVYSNSFYVTVKEKSTSPSSSSNQNTNGASSNSASAPKANVKTTITLKTVKVKKSAKKLVLQATLKKGKTPLKKTKVIFKFNGKKYTAKTNKKGVAKVTIKKSVLKKLKVGKKVKIQVSYGKTIAKKTIKVKK